MPKRNRNDEDEMDQINKRVCLIDNIPDEPANRKRNFENPEGYAPRKRMRLVGPSTIKYKAREYRDCIRKLYNMNKRLMHKIEMEKMKVRESEEKYIHLKNEVRSRGIQAHYWPTYPNALVTQPVVY